MSIKEQMHLAYLRRRETLGAEEIRRRNRESYQRNRERTLAKGRERYRLNPEPVIRRAVEYHRRNPEVLRRCVEKYRTLHPDRVRISWQKSNIKNAEKRRQRAIEDYYADHSESLKKAAEHREANRQWWREYDRKWRAKNRIKIAQWRDENRERINSRVRLTRLKNIQHYRIKGLLSARKRRARIKGCSVNERGIEEFIKKVRATPYVNCFWCGDKISGKKCEFDHIIAVANLGSHSVDNLCVSCRTCNRKKHSKSLDEWNRSKSNPQLILL